MKPITERRVPKEGEIFILGSILQQATGRDYAVRDVIVGWRYETTNGGTMTEQTKPADEWKDGERRYYTPSDSNVFAYRYADGEVVWQIPSAGAIG